MAKIKITIEMLTDVEGQNYPDKETVYEQILPDAQDEDVLNIIKAANRLASK